MMQTQFDIGLTGLWFAQDYGNVLSYYILRKKLTDFGYSVAMLGTYLPKENSPVSEFLQKAYPAHEIFDLNAEGADLDSLCRKVVLGSGQCWNYGIWQHYSKLFLMQFESTRCHKIAYAASFGHEQDFTPPDKRIQFSEALAGISHVFTRERCAAEYLRSAYDRQADDVLDPLLLEPEVLLHLAEQSGLSQASGSYLVLQMLDNHPELYRQAELAAAERNVQLIVMNNTELKSTEAFQAIFGTSAPEMLPAEDYLHLLAGAEKIITDSFSCCEISLALQKDVFGYINHKRGAVRFTDLYQKLYLSDFLLQSADTLNRQLELCIDYTQVSPHLELLRKKSLYLLQNALASPNRHHLWNTLSAAERKKNICRRLQQCPVVLLGAGENARNFLKKFGCILNIRCVMSNMPSEKYITLPDGTQIQVMRYRKAEIRADDFIIICRTDVKQYYKDAWEMLFKDGFHFGTDFVSSQFAESVLHHKKQLTFIGYCQLDVIRDIFSRIPALTETYDLKFFRMGRDTLKESYKYEECMEQLKITDKFCYVPLFSDTGKTEIDFLHYLPPDSQICTVPRLAFRGLHPYKAKNLETFHELTRFNGHVHWPFLYEEPIIDSLILSGCTDEQICQELLREDLIPEQEIQKNYKLALRSIQISEKETDIKISDFIEHEIRKQPLYKDCLHYQNCMYFELARRVSRFLQLYAEDELQQLQKKCEEEDKNFIDFTEIPVLPCVARTLGIQYADEYKTYRVRNYSGTIQLMNIRQWILAYCDYTRTILKCKDYFNQS